MLAAASAMEQQINAQAPALDSQVDRRDEGGRTAGRHARSPRPSAEFRSAAEKLGATQRGAMIPADVYDLAVRERDAFQKSEAREMTGRP